jgi:hypothetical protein
MNVMTAARELGLTDEGGERYGTIEESVVIEALLGLGLQHSGYGDLFADAVARVQRSRSAGEISLDADSVFARNRTSNQVQLRYRAEMSNIFADLAIDLALAGAIASSEPAPAPSF